MEDGLNVVLREDVFAFPEDIFQRLENEIDYLPVEQCKIRVKDKEYPIPRQIVAFGDQDLSCTFSGLTLSSQPWSPFLLEIKNCVENLTGADYNFVIVNRYGDGNACMGQHKDNEPDLEGSVGLLSFGETRSLIFKRQQCKDKIVELIPNSLIMINSPTNKLWTHGIPRQKKRAGACINLAFRKINPSMKRKPVEEIQGNSKKTKTQEPNVSIFVTL